MRHLERWVLILLFVAFVGAAACSREDGGAKAGADAAKAASEKPVFESDFESGDTSEWKGDEDEASAPGDDQEQEQAPEQGQSHGEEQE